MYVLYCCIYYVYIHMHNNYYITNCHSCLRTNEMWARVSENGSKVVCVTGSTHTYWN